MNEPAAVAGHHTSESYAEPLFRHHLLGGIESAAGVAVQRPDTLMQDRKPTDRRKCLATHGRTIHCDLKYYEDAFMSRDPQKQMEILRAAAARHAPARGARQSS
jgi:hypothetical protein